MEAEAALASSRRPSGNVRVGDQPARRSAGLKHRLHLSPTYRRSTFAWLPGTPSEGYEILLEGAGRILDLAPERAASMLNLRPCPGFEPSM